MVTTERPSAASFERRLRCHPFPINNQPLEWCLASSRLIPFQQAWSTQGQMQVAAMGGCQEWMASVIV
jgi:hypothetical protein